MPGTTNAKHVLWDVSMVVNSVDLSDHVKNVEIVETQESRPASGMGTLKQYGMPGVQSISDPKVTFWQNYAASKVYATLHAAFAAQTIFNIVAKASSAATSATNPAWTLPVFVQSCPIFKGEKGAEHLSDIVFALGGEWSIATS